MSHRVGGAGGEFGRGVGGFAGFAGGVGRGVVEGGGRVEE
jgi:hypothetical protein